MMYVAIYTLCVLFLIVWFVITIDVKDLSKLKRIFMRGIKRNPLPLLTLLLVTGILLTFISPLLLCVIIVAETLQRFNI